MSQKQELIAYFKNVRPEQIITDVLGPDTVSDVELDMIRTLSKSYRLSDEVINVLLHYVLLKTNMKPELSYVEKIAARWTRKRVKNAEKAVELVKKEHRQYSYWKGYKKQKTPVQRAKLDAIQAAIDSDLSDEQLGAFVRNLFRQ